jgi:hypothetical protein
MNAVEGNILQFSMIHKASIIHICIAKEITFSSFMCLNTKNVLDMRKTKQIYILNKSKENTSNKPKFIR